MPLACPGEIHARKLHYARRHTLPFLVRRRRRCRRRCNEEVDGGEPPCSDKRKYPPGQAGGIKNSNSRHEQSLCSRTGTNRRLLSPLRQSGRASGQQDAGEISYGPAEGRACRAGLLLPVAAMPGGLFRRPGAIRSGGRFEAARLSQRPDGADLRLFRPDARRHRTGRARRRGDRTRAIVEKARSPDARCTEMAANGQSCVAFVQKYFMQCRSA